MDPDLAENFEPYVLIHLWDRPKVIYEYAAKVQGSGALLDSFMTKLQKVCSQTPFFFLFCLIVINNLYRLRKHTQKACLNWRLRFSFPPFDLLIYFISFYFISSYFILFYLFLFSFYLLTFILVFQRSR